MIRACITFILCGLTAFPLYAHDVPTCPGATVLARLEGLEDPTAFVLHDGYAYTLNLSGSALLTISTDPQSPAIVSSLPLPNQAYNDIVAHQDALYLSDGTQQILVIDVSDRDNPQPGMELLTGNPVHRPVVINNLMYAGQSAIYDVSTPTAPQPAGSMSLPSPIGGHDQGLTFTTQLQPVDLTDPLNPTVPADAEALTDETKLIFEVDVHTKRLYASGYRSLTILDISDPSEPGIVSQQSVILPSNLYQATMLRSGSLIIWPSSTLTTDLLLTDYAAPQGPIRHEYAYQLGVDITERFRDAKKMDGRYYFLTDSAFLIAEVSTAPIVAAAPAGVSITELLKRGELIFTTEGESGIAIYSAPQPDQIHQLSTYTGIDTALAIDATDTHLYIAADRQDLVILDITDPSSPVYVTSVDTGIRTRNVKVIGSIMYAVDRSTGLTTFDITDPAHPVMLGQVALPGWNEHLAFNDNNTIAGVTSSTYDTYLVDISDPAAPAILSSISPLDPGGPDRSIHSTSFDGDILYTAELGEGYRVWDISDPTSPSLIAHHDFSYPRHGLPFELLGAIAYEVTPHRGRLLIANGNHGLAVYDNTDPANPVFETYFETETYGVTNSSVRDLVIEDNIVYAGVFGTGIKAYTVEPCWQCIADTNNDGALNFFDVTVFIQAFADQRLSVDFNNDAQFDFFDVSAFLTSYADGCP